MGDAYWNSTNSRRIELAREHFLKCLASIAAITPRPHNNLGLVERGRRDISMTRPSTWRTPASWIRRCSWFGCNLGVVQERQGHYEEAIATFQEALRRDPLQPGVWDHLGRSLAALRRWPEAEVALRRAVELEPRRDRLSGRSGLDAAAPGSPVGGRGAVRRRRPRWTPTGRRKPARPLGPGRPIRDARGATVSRRCGGRSRRARRMGAAMSTSWRRWRRPTPRPARFDEAGEAAQTRRPAKLAAAAANSDNRAASAAPYEQKQALSRAEGVIAWPNAFRVRALALVLLAAVFLRADSAPIATSIAGPIGSTGNGSGITTSCRARALLLLQRSE